MRASLTLFAAAVATVASLLLAPGARADDTTPPVIVFTPPAAGSLPKAPMTVTAKITDESKFFPQVFFRHSSGPFEKPIDMKKKPGAKDTFEATIPYKGDRIEFYIEAYDEFGNGPARAGDPDSPFKITLGEAPAPVVVKTQPAQNPGSATAAPAPATKPKPANNGATASSSSGGGRTWTWIVGGVGLGLLAGGLVAGLAVKTEDDAYKQALAGSSSSGGTSQVNNPSALQAQHDANVALGTKATILTISGAVLLAGGVTLFFVEPLIGGDESASNTNSGSSKSPAPASKPKPKHDDDSGFTGSNDVAPAPLPAVANLSVGAAPVQGGAAFALAGHF